MKKLIILILTVLMLCLGAASADTGFELGKPFMDFTAADTEGNTFILSEALKDHEAVLLNIWATWCGPCQSEFPDLEKAYQQYKDKVAFIALSYDDGDTNEKIAAFKEEHNLTFPMGRDEGSALYNYVAQYGVPTTVVIDRFGNTGFLRLGSFNTAEEVGNVLDRYLGDDYTETAVLTKIPKKGTTRAYPVSARALYVDNENVKKFNFTLSGADKPLPVYVVNDQTAHLRFTISSADDAADMMYYDDAKVARVDLPDILDAQRNVFAYDQVLESPEGVPYLYGLYYNVGGDGDPDLMEFFLVEKEENLEDVAAYLRSMDYEVTWEEAAEEPAQAPEQKAYVIHVLDQDGNPVPGAAVNFCTDAACTMAQGGEDGVITFDGAPGNYHVQILKVPEGYSFDQAFELYTGETYGEWVLHVANDRLK